MTRHTDTIIRLTSDGGAGLGTAVLNIDAKTWNLKRDYNSNLDFSFAWTAIDVQGRKVYANTGNNQGSVLYSYDIPTRAIKSLGALPGTRGRKPVFDTVNQILFWVGDEIIYGYRPANATWETVTPTNPSAFSQAVSGLGRVNHCVFDPYQNAIMCMGGLSEDESALISNPYVWLFRYAESGGGGVTLATVPTGLVSN